MTNLWLGRTYGRKAQAANIFRNPGLAKKYQKYFEKAVELDGDNLEARADLMQYYMQAPGSMGGSDSKVLEQAQAIRLRDKLQGFLIFAIFYEQQKDFNKAGKELQSAIDIFPDSLKVYTALSGKYLQPTERGMHACIAQNPVGDNYRDLSWAYFCLGQILQFAEKKEAAKAAYQQAFKFDTEHKMAKKALKKI